MNRLPIEKRAQIIGLLVEGTTQKADNSYNEPSDYVDQLKTLWQVG